MRTTRIDRHCPEELRGPNTDYVRFIVLTQARSGSSFLIQSLRSHPRVLAFGEILGPGNVWFNTPGFPDRHQGLRRLRDRDPVGFLDSFVFRGYAPDTCAVGFKVFYTHLEAPPFRPLIDHLRDMPGLRIIHLERRNLLRAYLSDVLRTKTGVGWLHSETDRRPVSAELDGGACERYFLRQRESRARYATVFEGCRTLRVVYEDLRTDFAQEAMSVQRFLGVEPMPLSTPTVVQEVRPLREAITNYEELARRFRSTEWAAFFD